MEKELKNLRKAMNSSTHKGIQFTEFQKKKIRALLHQREIYVTRRPRFLIYIMTTLAAFLFVLLLYTDSLPNFYSTGDVNRVARHPIESEWKVQNENIPSFVQSNDIEMIDWNKKAVDLGNNILGNENKSGVIGADMPSINIDQKWMWHLWGVDNPRELTAVGFHRETKTVHQIITSGWTIVLGGENNGADAHAPSSVNIPTAGEWAILLYVDGKLYDVLVYNIKH